jgi:putative heme utilization carrier protein HutX
MSVDRDTILKALKESKTPYTAFVARDLGIPESDIFKALPADECTELDKNKLAEIMAEIGKCESVLLIVKSGGAVLEVVSSISKQSESRGYYNVMGEPAHMHIMPHGMDSIFAVHREPGTPKPMKYSIQFYDHEGKPALKIFLTQDKESKYREGDMAIFDKIKESYAKV